MPAETALSVVVPCFRDESQLPELFRRIGPVLDTWPGEAELIVVDDGSPDATAGRARELADGCDHPTTVLELGRNRGQHGALIAGFGAARGRVLVTLDSDLRYPPEQITRLVAAISPQCPVAAGVRVDRGDALARRAVTRFLSWWIGRRSGFRLSDVGCMFRAYEREAAQRLVALHERRPFLPAMTARLGIAVAEVPVRTASGEARSSRYRPLALVRLFVHAVTDG